jgi:predicted TIM-barrel fold metal-dependent hydrolase
VPAAYALADISPADREAVLGGNAVRVYGLTV